MSWRNYFKHNSKLRKVSYSKYPNFFSKTFKPKLLGAIIGTLKPTHYRQWPKISQSLQSKTQNIMGNVF